MRSTIRRFSAVLLVGACALAVPAPLAPVSAQRGDRAHHAPGYRIGQPVQVEWNGGWYDATIVAVESDGRFRIRYEGWSTTWDEPVSLDRIRGRAGYEEPSPPPPPPPYEEDRYGHRGRRGRHGRHDGNLVVNGGFEHPGLPGGRWQVLPEVPGWFVTSGPGIEVQAGAAGRPYEGRQHLELDGHSPASMAQDVPTERPGSYLVRLAVSPRPGTPASDNRIGVYWDGELVARVEADGSQLSETSWQVVSVVVRARAPRTRLELRDEGAPNGYGAYVDDVRVTPLR